MATLRPEDLDQYLNHCYRVLLQPNVHGEGRKDDWVLEKGSFQFGDSKETSNEEMEEEESSEESSEEGRDVLSLHRIWALENLYELVMSTGSLNPLQLVRLLFVVSCIQGGEEVKPRRCEVSEWAIELPETVCYTSDEYLTQVTSYATPVFSSSVREKAAELLSAITRTLAVKKEDEKKSELGMTADHELYVYCILQEYLHMETALSQPAFSKFQLIREWSEEEKTARATLLEQIEEIRSRSQEGSSMQKLEQVFERLFVNVLLEQIFKPEYSQFIPDLVEC